MALVVQTLSEQIFTLVRDRIISGSLPVEVAIRQDALAAELGVSKIPLREALVRLEQGTDRDQMLRLMKQAGQLDPANRVIRADLARAVNAGS